LRITASDLDQLRRRRAAGTLVRQPHLATPVGVVLFIPGALTNPLNASGWTWRKRANWTTVWHEKTADALLESGYRPGLWSPAAPKRITFTAHIRRKFDSQDNLRACLKPVVDALQKCGVIHADDDASGHQFVYPDQCLNRSWRGVEVRIELL